MYVVVEEVKEGDGFATSGALILIGAFCIEKGQ